MQIADSSSSVKIPKENHKKLSTTKSDVSWIIFIINSRKGEYNPFDIYLKLSTTHRI